VKGGGDMHTHFYHASNLGGLTELLPLSKMHGEDGFVCYLSPDRAYALFYLRDMEINHVTAYIDKNSIAIYQEQFSNQLMTMYHGRSGYLYTCINDGSIRQGHTSGVWISKSPVYISESEHVCNVYDEIIKAEQHDLVRIIRYEDQTAEHKRGHLEIAKHTILANKLQQVDTPKSRFYKHNFPTAWLAAMDESERHSE
jgi:hypothetical protein